MRILIIGGTGVLSTDIVTRSLECGYDVSILNRGHHSSIIPPHVNVYKADIRDLNEVSDKIGGSTFDVIVDFLSFKENDLKTSFGYFKNKCTQYIFISSACVFRRSTEDGILSEDSPKPNMNWIYSIDKYKCEEWLLRQTKEDRCKYTIVRPYITYGNTRIPYGIAPLARFHWTIASRILNGKPMFLWDNGSAKCTLTHTRDFAYNFVQLYLNEKAYDEDINFVGNQVYSWREMLETLYDLLGKENDKNNIVSIPSEQIAQILPCFKDNLLGDRALNAVFDNSKLKRIIPDFKQSISLRDGMADTLEYYRNNSYLSGIDYKYDAQIDYLIEKATGKGYHYIDYLDNHRIKDWIVYSKHRNKDKWSGIKIFVRRIKEIARFKQI